MSPEVVFKKPYDSNIDVWSLGILLYELTIGTSPFKAKNLSEITQRFKSFKELNFPDFISIDLKNLITGILKMDPEKRFNLEQILNDKWVKKMLNVSGYTEPISLLNTKETKEENITGKKLEKQTFFTENKNISLSNINETTDQKFLVSPKKTMELSISKIRKPIFHDKKLSMGKSISENYEEFNKTEYGKSRESGFNRLNSSFLTKTQTDITAFKSIDYKRNKIFFNKEENEENQGKILKTMENLMSQINITQDNKSSLIKKYPKSTILKNHIKNIKEEENTNRSEPKKRFLFENIKYKGKKENFL